MNLVVELATFGSLRNVISKWNEIPPTLIVAWMCDMLDALCYIHSKGVKHRDLKPDNFLAFRMFRLKLCDFGLATEHLNDVSSTNGGSRPYTAPEILLGQRSSYKSDIFSFGLTAIQLISGKPPPRFDLRSTIKVEDVVRLLPQELIQTNELVELLKACIKVDPEIRPTAEEAHKRCLAILVANGSDPRLSGNKLFDRIDEMDSIMRGTLLKKRYGSHDNANVVGVQVDMTTDQDDATDDENAMEISSLSITSPMKRNATQSPFLRDCTPSLLVELKGHTKDVIVIVVSESENRLYSSGKDGRVIVWDALSHDRINELKAQAVSLVVSGVTHRLFAGCIDDFNSRVSSIHIWDTMTFKHVAALSGHTDLIKCLVVDDRFNRLYSGSFDKTIKAWDLSSNTCILTLAHYTSWVWCLALSPTLNRLYSGTSDGMVKVWDISDIHNLTCVYSQQTRSQWIRAITLSMDESRLYVAGGDFTEVWNTADHQWLQTFSPNNGHQLRDMIQYQEKRILSIETTDQKKGSLKILDVPTNLFISHMEAQDTEIHSIAFFHGGQILYTVGVKDSIIKVWSI
jgi:hypothetical protein